MRPVLRVAVQPGDKVLIPGDLHAGINDWPATAIIIDLADKLGVTHVNLIGDNADCHGISRHPKEPDRLAQTLAVETKELTNITTALHGISTARWFGAIEGNHDDRVYDVVEEYPALLGTEWYDWFGLAYEGFECVPRGGSVVFVGDGSRVVAEHGDNLNGLKTGGGKNPAVRCLDNYPAQCTAFGHCHTLDRKERMVWVEGRNVLRGAYGCGHLSQRDKHRYAGDNAYEQGGIIIEFHDGGTGDRNGAPQGFQVHTLRVQRDRRDLPYVRFAGKTYR